MALTATATRQTRTAICQSLGMKKPVIISINGILEPIGFADLRLIDMFTACTHPDIKEAVLK